MERLSKSKDWLCCHWKDVKANWRNTEDPMKLGMAWSKGFVVLLAVLAFVPYSTGSSGWEFKFWTLLKSPPNEIGDTLAGIAGALAFLWIIVTVQLQSKELKAQRQELELARHEYAKMAVAQNKQVEVLEKQSRIFEDEQRERDEARSRALLDERVEALARLIREKGKPRWGYQALKDGARVIGDVSLYSRALGESSDEAIRTYSTFACRKAVKLAELSDQGAITGLKGERSFLIECTKACAGVLKLKERLSEADKVFVDSLRLEELNTALAEAESISLSLEAAQ